MSRGRQVATIAAVLVALPISACGSADDGPQTQARPSLTPPVIARANANCRDFLREIRQIAKGALANPPTTVLDLTTQRLVKPSIPVLERVARRQHALEQAARNPHFDLYADLFDPIVVLSQQRLSAGREGNYPSSRGFENMLTDLALEQRAVARRIGLSDCDLDFPRILLSSLSE